MQAATVSQHLMSQSLHSRLLSRWSPLPDRTQRSQLSASATTGRVATAAVSVYTGQVLQRPPLLPLPAASARSAVRSSHELFVRSTVRPYSVATAAAAMSQSDPRNPLILGQTELITHAPGMLSRFRLCECSCLCSCVLLHVCIKERVRMRAELQATRNELAALSGYEHKSMTNLRGS